MSYEYYNIVIILCKLFSVFFYLLLKIFLEC